MKKHLNLLLKTMPVLLITFITFIAQAYIPVDVHNYNNTKDTLAEAASKGDLERVKLLIDKGVDPNTRWGLFLGRTPLMFAAENGHTEVVEFLVSPEINAEVNTHSRLTYRTALMMAAENCHTDIVDILTNNGAKVDLRSWTQHLY